MSILKSTIYLFILTFIFTLTSCGGGEESTDEEKKQENAQNTSEENTEELEQSTKPKLDDSEISNYGIEEYYNLWLALEKEKLKDINTEDMPEGKIDIKDVANGYMKVTGSLGVMGFHTMALWKAKNGKTTLGIIFHSCGPVCGADNVQFYEVKEGSLTEVTEDIFPMEKQNELNKKCFDTHEKEMNGPPGSVGCWINLPRTGTSIKTGFAKLTIDYEPTYTKLYAELTYNAKDGSFTLEEK